MLSIGKVGAGTGGYYVDAVADGTDVGRAEFLALLDNRNPTTGEKLAARRGKIAAYDLTFSAPKSVSLRAALIDDPTIAAAVRAAQHRAVESSLDWLQDEVPAIQRK